MVPPSKRAAVGDDAAPPSRRLRVTPPPPAASPASNNSAPPPPSPPRKSFATIVLVVLISILPVKCRTTDLRLRIGRLEMGFKALRHELRQVHETFLSKQDSIKKLLRALSSKLDTIKGPSPDHRNHEHPTQGTNREGTSAEAGTEGKDASIRLCFLCDEMESPVFHGEEIKSIRIGIFRGDQKIESGLLSKLNIEVLALDGNFPYSAKGSWTSKEFDKYIAYGLDGKGHVLEGKGTNAQLINGECHLDSIKFRESSRRGKFIIAARVRDTDAICDRVQEAVMNPVTVQDHRNKYNQKSKHPKLDDGVQCLKNISKTYSERLKNQNIRTVEQFLKALYKDENSLCSSLKLKPEHKSWVDMVTHAQTCYLEENPELKSYRCEENDVELFFDYVHRLVGARFGGRYVASEDFKPSQKKLVETLKRNAYGQLDGLTWDFEMRDNIPVRIGMNTEGGAGPSCIASSASQQINSARHIAEHQGTSARELLRPCAPHDPNSVPDPNSAYNCQASGSTILQNVLSVGGIPTVQGLMIHGLNESSFAIASDGPGTSSSVPHQLTTQGNQDQGTGFAAQQQHFHVVDGMSQDASSFAVVNDGPSTSSSVPYLTTQNNKEGEQGLRQGEMPHYPEEWSTDDIFDQLGTASLPNDGTMGSPVPASSEWFECQGPGNTPFLC